MTVCLTGGVLSSLLPQYPNQKLTLDHRSIVWNSKQGFTIRSPTFSFVGLIFCQAVAEGVVHNSPKYFVHRHGQHHT